MGHVDDCKRLLDDGWKLVLWQAMDGGYRALAKHREGVLSDEYVNGDTPEQALIRLVEKMGAEEEMEAERRRQQICVDQFGDIQ